MPLGCIGFILGIMAAIRNNENTLIMPSTLEPTQRQDLLQSRELPNSCHISMELRESFTEDLIIVKMYAF